MINLLTGLEICTCCSPLVTFSFLSKSVKVDCTGNNEVAVRTKHQSNQMLYLVVILDLFFQYNSNRLKDNHANQKQKKMRRPCIRQKTRRYIWLIWFSILYEDHYIRQPMQSEPCHVSTYKFPISVSILNQIRLTHQTPSKACEIFPLLRAYLS